MVRATPVDHDHRRAEQRSFDRGRTAGDDGAIRGGERVVRGAFDAPDRDAGARAVCREEVVRKVGRGGMDKLEPTCGLRLKR